MLYTNSWYACARAQIKQTTSRQASVASPSRMAWWNVELRWFDELMLHFYITICIYIYIFICIYVCTYICTLVYTDYVLLWVANTLLFLLLSLGLLLLLLWFLCDGKIWTWTLNAFYFILDASFFFSFCVLRCFFLYFVILKLIQ